MKYLLLIHFFLSSLSVRAFVGSFAPHRGDVSLCATTGKNLMSDIDIMCLENAADLCSFYEECDIEEREAILNRFASETEIMAERMATLSALVKHLKTGDHQYLQEEEVADLQEKILDLVDTEIRVNVNGLSPWSTSTTIWKEAYYNTRTTRPTSTTTSQQFFWLQANMQSIPFSGDNNIHKLSLHA